MNMPSSFADFFNVFSSPSTTSIDDEYYAIEDDFEKKFGYRVPREMLPDSITMDQIKEAMKSCLDCKQDRLFEILDVLIDEHFLY